MPRFVPSTEGIVLTDRILALLDRHDRFKSWRIQAISGPHNMRTLEAYNLVVDYLWTYIQREFPRASDIKNNPVGRMLAYDVLFSKKEIRSIQSELHNDSEPLVDSQVIEFLEEAVGDYVVERDVTYIRRESTPTPEVGEPSTSSSINGTSLSQSVATSHSEDRDVQNDERPQSPTGVLIRKLWRIAHRDTTSSSSSTHDTSPNQLMATSHSEEGDAQNEERPQSPRGSVVHHDTTASSSSTHETYFSQSVATSHSEDADVENEERPQNPMASVAHHDSDESVEPEPPAEPFINFNIPGFHPNTAAWQEAFDTDDEEENHEPVFHPSFRPFLTRREAYWYTLHMSQFDTGRRPRRRVKRSRQDDGNDGPAKRSRKCNDIGDGQSGSLKRSRDAACGGNGGTTDIAKRLKVKGKIVRLHRI